MDVSNSKPVFEREVVIFDSSKLQPRPVTLFIQKAMEFSSFIWVEIKGTNQKANAKSILGLLALNIKQGTPIKLIAEGNDAQNAVNALAKYLA